MNYESEVGQLSAQIAHAATPKVIQRLREQLRQLKRAKRDLRPSPPSSAGGPSAEVLVYAQEVVYRCPECGAVHEDWQRRCELCGALMGPECGEGGQ